MVTGGGGFLGKSVVGRLERAGVAGDEIFVPRSKDYITGFLLAFGLAAGAPRLPQTRWWLITSLYATLANLGVLARVFPTYP